jgi:hypothetical protein
LGLHNSLIASGLSPAIFSNELPESLLIEFSRAASPAKFVCHKNMTALGLQGWTLYQKLAQAISHRQLFFPAEPPNQVGNA